MNSVALQENSFVKSIKLNASLSSTISTKSSVVRMSVGETPNGKIVSSVSSDRVIKIEKNEMDDDPSSSSSSSVIVLNEAARFKEAFLNNSLKKLIVPLENQGGVQKKMRKIVNNVNLEDLLKSTNYILVNQRDLPKITASTNNPNNEISILSMTDGDSYAILYPCSRCELYYIKEQEFREHNCKAKQAPENTASERLSVIAKYTATAGNSLTKD